MFGKKIYKISRYSPPPCLTVELTHSGLRASPDLLQTLWHPRLPTKQNLDSSDQMTFFHCAWVQFSLSLHHLYLASRCLFISNGFFLAARPYNLASWSLLLTVVSLMSMPCWFRRVFPRPSNVARRFWRAKFTIFLSSLDVVFLLPPPRSLGCRVPVFL